MNGTPVAEIDSTGETVRVFPSVREAGRQRHMSHQTVLDRCNGKIKNEFALSGTSFRFFEEGKK